MNINAITSIALAALVASTSLAAAAGGGIIIKPDKSDQPIYIPIYVPPKQDKPDIIPSEPVKPKPIFIPIDIGGKPDIPIYPLPGGLAFGDPKAGDGPEPMLALSCAVDDPLGTTDSFWIVNASNVALPVGLKIRYRVPATGDRGAFLLPRQVAVGGKLLIPNLLHDAPDGAPCTAQIII